MQDFFLLNEEIKKLIDIKKKKNVTHCSPKKKITITILTIKVLTSKSVSLFAVFVYNG